MTIYSIPDVEKFLELLKKSRGDVILHLPDGSQLDLKRNQTARQLMWFIHPDSSGLRISLFNPADVRAFMRYMMESGVSR